MNDYFPNDEYHTPYNVPRAFIDKVFFKASFAYHLRIIRRLIENRMDVTRKRYTDDVWVDHSYDFFADMEKFGAKFHITGIDQLKSDEPYVIVSNHMSTLETAIFPALIRAKRPVTFVIKESLVKVPLFGPVMRTRDPIVVGRENPREDLVTVLNEGTSHLQRGTSVVIFPQATRMVEFIPEKFNSLGVKLAKKASVKILPVAIKTDYWGIGKLIKEFGKMDRRKPVHVSIGKPIESSDVKAAQETVIRFIQSHLNLWNRED